jgi:hypothetical protein
MIFQNLRYRLTERVAGLFNDDRKFVKMFTRLGFLALLAGMVMVVAPTSATENSPDQTFAELGPTDTQTATIDSTTVTPTPTISVLLIDTSTIGESLTALSIKETITALDTQPKFLIKAPAILTIDPRATKKYLPQLDITGSEYVLACISGSNFNLDIATKSISTDGITNGKIIVGDLTPTLFVSGKTNEVINLINSEGGLLAYSTAGGLADRWIEIKLVAMTNPGVKRSFCDFAKSSTTITFKSMGLEMSTSKSGITLK